ncbi:MAG: ATP-binding protein, partial [Cyanobacteria bacterium J06626_14]
NYNIKVNQMGFGFREQSDNAAVLAAATRYHDEREIDPELVRQVRQILQNEVRARDIEYATLVGPDRRILVSAYKNRQGEVFDPKGLVSYVLEHPEQIKTSELLSWEDLSHENLPRSAAIQPQSDVLIRYTVTPVIANDGVVAGVLVSGDVVNGKLDIALNTVTAFKGGYSAVYQRNEDGTFTLTTAFAQNTSEAQEFLAQQSISSAHLKRWKLPNFRLLEQAIAANGTPVTGRYTIDDTKYTLAASVLHDFSGSPIAIIVRGTPETSLNALLRNSLIVQLAVASLAFAIDFGLARFLGQVLVDHIKRLQSTAQRFSQGNREARTEVFAHDEIGALTQTFNEMADSINLQDGERQRAEAEIRRYAAQLESSNQELEAFAYSVSHDLRAPLRAIDGFSQILREDYEAAFDEAGQDYLERIHRNVIRMDKLIDDLLSLSRVSRTTICSRKVNLSTLAQAIIDELTASAPERSVKWVIEPIMVVSADAVLMQIVLTNLLNNAWKFTQHHPIACIEFGITNIDQHTTYFVRDDGAGFDMAYSDMLFGVFQRLHSTHEFPGTGIGLATVQRAIHRHGGQVWAEGAIEQGATFYFTLPHATFN